MNQPTTIFTKEFATVNDYQQLQKLANRLSNVKELNRVVATELYFY